MSQNTQIRQDDTDVVSLDSGLEALQTSPEFRGPVEPLDGHPCNDHFAHIYEDPAEQVAASVPFLRQGLERGERCMYVIDDLSEEQVVGVMRDAGVDVDAALESGQLSFHTVDETYLRNGTFEPDEMVEFYAETVEEATEEYTALRIAAETTWLQNVSTSFEQFMEYESKVNALFEEEDCVALCHYDRTELTPDTVKDIIRTHPHLIYDGTVCHNFYYTPPEEFLEPDQTAREVDRMMGTLVDRTEAKATLQEREQFLRTMYDITSDTGLSSEEKLDAVFDLGCEWFDLELGAMARIDPETDHFEVEATSGEHEHLVPGAQVDLSETYCRVLADDGGTVDITDPVGEGFDGTLAYDEFGVESYLGTRIELSTGLDRTMFFVSHEPREEPFSESKRTSVDLMGQWVSYELEREQREQFLREQTEVIANPEQSFEEKLQAMFDLACEQFGLELGALARVDVEDDSFEVEHVSEDHAHFEPGVELPLTETYCTAAADIRSAATVTDPTEQGYDDITVYEEFGIRAYLGTYVELDAGTDRTFFFVTSEERDAPFSEEEEAYLDLMGRWVKYELEREERERELERTERQFEATFNNPVSFVGLLDPDGTVRRINENALEFAGIEESEVRGEKFWETPWFAHSEAVRSDLRASTERAADGEYVRAEIPHQSPDGETVLMDSMLEPVRDEDGEVTAIVPSGHEITELRKRERVQRKFNDVTSDPDLPFEEKIERLLELGCERFDLEIGALTRLSRWDDDFRLEAAVAPDELPEEGLLPVQPGDGCFCRRAISEDEPTVAPDVRENGWDDDPIHQQFGLTTYFGTAVSAENDPYGTFWFGDTSPRSKPFSEAERSFLEQMGEWVSQELTRRENDRYQRELHEITADGDLDFSEMLDRLLELGCERFGLDAGMLNRKRENTLSIEQIHGGHPDLEAGSMLPDPSENYCSKVTSTGETACVADAAAAGWEEDPLYREFGLESYAGVQVGSQEECYGTLCFASVSPREKEFIESEETFLEQMGEWVSQALEQRRRETQLAALNEMSRAIMSTESEEGIAEVAVEYAEESLELPLTAVVTYDDQTGELSPAAQTPSADDRLPTAKLCDRDDGEFWEAFVSGEVLALENVSCCDGACDDITGTLAIPLGRQGLFVTATTVPDGFSDATREFAETTAATVEATFTRADREQQLQNREEMLEEQNETLERLNRVNDIIRDIDQALVQASTRQEIEQVVCEQLADVGPYELAWVGDHDAVTDEVTPIEWGGADKGYLDEISVTADDRPTGQGPVGEAVRTRESQAVDDILQDDSFRPWRQEALNRGYHGCIALPLVYKEALYGVLVVYAGQPGVFGGLERAVLDELSDTIAYAINTVESKKALVSDEVTNLEFSVEDTGLEILELARELDCTVTMESLIPRSDGGRRMFFSTRGTSAESVLDFGPRLPTVEFSLVSEYDDDGERVCLFEAGLSEESLAETVLAHGGQPRAITVEDGSANVTVELAADAALREFVEVFSTEYPDSELVAQRSQERPHRSPTEQRVALTEEMTARQLESLQTAYFAGYFEQPRSQSGSDVAETLDVSQPTFNSHLRTAQRKVYRQLFDAESV